MALSPEKQQKEMERLQRMESLRTTNPTEYWTFRYANPQLYANANNYYTQLATKQEEEARAANEKRYAEMMGIYDTMVSQYAPGGQFMKGAEAQLEKTKQRDVASQIAQNISSGLYGTTTTGTAGAKWEEEIGAPQRLKLEDIRMQAYAGALGQKAGAIERREDMYPDYSAIMNAYSQIYQPTSAPTTIRSSGEPQYAFGSAAYAKKQADEQARKLAWEKLQFPERFVPKE